MIKVKQCRCYNCRNKVGRCMNHKCECGICECPSIVQEDWLVCSYCWEVHLKQQQIKKGTGRSQA